VAPSNAARRKAVIDAAEAQRVRVICVATDASRQRAFHGHRHARTVPPLVIE
jgi:hypothetical protein